MLTCRLAARTALCVALAMPATLDAQRGVDAVPSDVVQAILRHIDAASDISAIYLGDRLPDTLSSRISIPPGSRIIASLTGVPSFIIGAVPGDPDSVRFWFAEEFERRGYEPASWMGRPPPFRPAERSPSNSGYCDGGTHFSVSAEERVSDSVEFVVRLRPARECRPADQHDFSTVAMAGYGYSSFSMSGDGPAELPLLFHPLTAEVTPECTMAERLHESQAGATGTLSTTAGTEAAIAHYGRQLDSLGWRHDSLFTGAIESWTKQDSTGTELRLVLSFQSVAGVRNCRVAHMTIREVRR